MEKRQTQNSDYIVIKANDDGVSVIGLTRGTDTRFHHSEKLDKGEILIAQFTEHTSAIKIRGNAKVLTGLGEIESEMKK
ncbi:trp RNA-binding attenuation protein MtrB [Neobacillus ginsengisoli]|uniref:Transcription attenuation protein MtrB n=1 Tax=Neobacillus ginsengisoli TaxID=904295 RepID=A0ABT9XQ80_9BACI|nr:trp RNA-binding attenuation protein MtrB [Neobacillus ginsengisoli]MDQ0197506.1 transcription attenuation protein (tryptophan RNA-binding attenuator protein) [Neobacillus ginsengisoli]